jgi:hypothetical protein
VIGLMNESDLPFWRDSRAFSLNGLRWHYCSVILWSIVMTRLNLCIESHTTKSKFCPGRNPRIICSWKSPQNPVRSSNRNRNEK